MFWCTVLQGSNQPCASAAPVELITFLTKLLCTNAGCTGEVLYWDLVEGNVVKKFKAHSGVVCSMAIHPEGSHLLTSALDGVVKVWDADPKKKTQ